MDKTEWFDVCWKDLEIRCCLVRSVLVDIYIFLRYIKVLAGRTLHNYKNASITDNVHY